VPVIEQTLCKLYYYVNETNPAIAKQYAKSLTSDAESIEGMIFQEAWCDASHYRAKMRSLVTCVGRNPESAGLW